jgi:hypothetical protein
MFDDPAQQQEWEHNLKHLVVKAARIHAEVDSLEAVEHALVQVGHDRAMVEIATSRYRAVILGMADAFREVGDQDLGAWGAVAVDRVRARREEGS